MSAPPAIPLDTFGTALQEFANVVGKDWAFTTDNDLDLYRDAYSSVRGAPEKRIASAAVAPSTAKEVQAVVRTPIPTEPSMRSRPAGIWAMVAQLRPIPAA
jgi:(+)-pinoresinol hydroxylase